MKKSFKKHITIKQQELTWLISPDNEWKAFWDILLFFVLLASCVLTPL